jgi:hypothetical protein
LTWTLSEISDDVGFYVLRSCGASESFDLLPSDYIKREGNSLTYIDRDLEPGTCYRYRIEYRDENGRGILFETGSVTVPAASLTLMQNHPNPFNPSTEIRYCLPGRFYVVLDVYDVSGSFVIRLDEGSRDRGPHVVKWDGRDGQGRQVGSGVYFCTLVAGKTRITKKMILLK